MSAPRTSQPGTSRTRNPIRKRFGTFGKAKAGKLVATTYQTKRSADRAAARADERAKVIANLTGEKKTRDATIAGTRSVRAGREPISDFSLAVSRFGQELGKPVPSSEVSKVFDRIAKDAVDVFGSQVAARRYLDEAVIDGGKTARDVATSQGLGRILLRLDALRFGSNG
ncbi:hypothetical protein [Brevundimonas sp.]|uniref:hypothetical protein n=1 Tax=Brevundimonas sp. TaxID=1871086 RepID=UPI00356646E7